MITIMLSLQGFTHSWAFSMTIYKTFEKDFDQIYPMKSKKNVITNADKFIRFEQE